MKQLTPVFHKDLKRKPFIAKAKKIDLWRIARPVLLLATREVRVSVRGKCFGRHSQSGVQNNQSGSIKRVNRVFESSPMGVVVEFIH